MKLRELLTMMADTSQKIDVVEPKICGGTPRDRYMGRLENIEDLDLTNGESTIGYLAEEFYNSLSKKYNVKRTTASDGHNTIFLGSFKMDFSSNFNAPNIVQDLSKLGITNPTDMQKEIFSRDFTCNALLLSFDLKTLTDPTNHGFKDIKDKTIRTCLSPDITLTTNKNRVIRAIYLAAKLDFNLDPNIISYVQKNPKSVSISTNKVLSEKLTEAFKRDADKASYLLTQMGLWNLIPISDSVYPYYEKYLKGSIISKASKKSTPYLKRNFDMGEGLYSNLDKYKSVESFRDSNHLDFPIDDDLTWIIGDSENFEGPKNLGPAANDIPNDGILPGSVGLGDFESYPYSAQIGGYLDKYLSQPDFDDKPESTIDFGNDLTDDDEEPYDLEEPDLKHLFNKYLNSEPDHGLYGLPDGVDLPDEDLGDPTMIDPDYGTLGPESLIYEDKWNI